MSEGFETAARLTAAIASRRVSHAFFISGSDALATAAFARRAAAAACAGGDEAALAFCPEYIELSGGSMKADGAHELIDELAHKAISGSMRAIVILDAHRMNAVCQNILLKTIEEPTGETLFLLTGNANAALPTVVSRCSVIRLPLPGGDAARERLTSLGADAAKARLYGAAGGGSMELSEALYTDEKLRSARLAAIESAKLLLSGELPASLVKPMCSGRNADISLVFMLSFFRDVLSCATGGAVQENPDAAADIERFARRFTTGRIACIIEMISNSAMELGANRGAEFFDVAVINKLFIEISEAIHQT